MHQVLPGRGPAHCSNSLFSAMPSVYSMAKEFDLDILGVIPEDDSIMNNPMEKSSAKVVDAIKQFYFRLNLPQEGL